MHGVGQNYSVWAIDRWRETWQYSDRMHSAQESERRVRVRSQAAFPVIVQRVPPAATSGPVSIHSECRNVSDRGMCLLISEVCEVSSLLRCEIVLPGSSASVPTLAYVRWRENDGVGFLTGVEFLL